MNAQLQGNITFDQVLSQPAYQKLDAPKKFEVAQDFFSKHVASQPAYQTLKPQQQDEIFQDFQVKYQVRPIEAPPALTLNLPSNPTPQAMKAPDIPQVTQQLSQNYQEDLPFFDNTQIRAQADFSPLQNVQAGIGGALGGLFKGVLPVEQIDNPLPVGPQDLSSLYNTNPVGQMAETATRVPTSFFSNALASIPTGGAYNAAYGAISQAEQNRLAQEQAIKQMDLEAVKRLIGAALPASVTGGLTGLLSAKVPLFLGKGLPARVATGASLGYAGDVVNSAQQQYATQGQLDPSTLDYRPNVGTLIGTAGGVAPEVLQAGRQLLGRVQQVERPRLPELPSFGRDQQNDRPISMRELETPELRETRRQRLAGMIDRQRPEKTAIETPFIKSKRSGKANLGKLPNLLDEAKGREILSAQIRLNDGNELYGAIKINEKHGPELKKSGFENDPAGFVEAIIKKKDKRFYWDNENKSLIVAVPASKTSNNLFAVELVFDKAGNYYSVKSAGRWTKRYKKGVLRELTVRPTIEQPRLSDKPDGNRTSETQNINRTTRSSAPIVTEADFQSSREKSSGVSSQGRNQGVSSTSQNSMPSEASLPSSKPVKKQEVQKDSRREQAEKPVQAKTIKSEVNPSVTPKTDRGKKLDSVVKAYQQTTDPFLKIELAGQVDELARSMPKEEFVQVMKQLSQEQLDEIGKEVGC